MGTGMGMRMDQGFLYPSLATIYIYIYIHAMHMAHPRLKLKVSVLFGLGGIFLLLFSLGRVFCHHVTEVFLGHSNGGCVLDITWMK